MLHACRMALTFHICNVKLVNQYHIYSHRWNTLSVMCCVAYKYVYSIRRFPSSSGGTIEISIRNVAINIVVFRLKLSIYEIILCFRCTIGFSEENLERSFKNCNLHAGLYFNYRFDSRLSFARPGVSNICFYVTNKHIDMKPISEETVQ